MSAALAQPFVRAPMPRLVSARIQHGEVPVPSRPGDDLAIPAPPRPMFPAMSGRAVAKPWDRAERALVAAGGVAFAGYLSFFAIMMSLLG